MRVVDVYQRLFRLNSVGCLDALCSNLSTGRGNLYRDLRKLGLDNVDAELVGFLLLSAFSKAQPGLWSPLWAVFSVLGAFMLRTVLPGTRPVLWFGERSWAESLLLECRWQRFATVQSIPPCSIPDKGPISLVIGAADLSSEDFPPSAIEAFLRATVEQRASGGIELLTAFPVAVANGSLGALGKDLGLQVHSSLSRIPGASGGEFEVSLLCG